MKALVFAGVRRLEPTTVPDPALREPGDAIVRVRAAGVCGSDLHVSAASRPASTPAP